MRNFMDLSRALKSLADAFHTIKLKLDGLYDTAGALGNGFELIETITLTEDVAVIERTTEPDNTPYNFSKVFIDCYCPVAASTQYCVVQINSNNDRACSILQFTDTTNTRYSYALLNKINNMIIGYTKAGQTNTGNNGALSSTHDFFFDTNIEKIKLVPNLGVIPTDSIIKIYAVRA